LRFKIGGFYRCRVNGERSKKRLAGLAVLTGI